jgi:hypothetical protein
MAEYVARLVGVGNTLFYDVDEQPAVYLKGYDPEPEPTGRVVYTEVITDAMKFASGGDAMGFTLQVHPTNPTRPDGRPNKPLTAYCWLFEPAEVKA